MDKTNSLTALGLTEQEASVYLALLKLGGSMAAPIAKEAEMQRTAVYPILKSLASKGHVLTYFRKNHHFYYAQKPDKLKNIFEDKIKSFERVIPFLEVADKKQAEAIGLRFIETKDEMKLFYKSVLEDYKNKQYYIIGDIGGWEKIDAGFLKQYRKERAMVKLKTKALLSHSSRRLNPTDKSLLREVRYLPEKFKFQSTMDIFNDKILIVNPDLSSLAVVIAVPAMVDIFKSMFEVIWESTDQHA